MRNDAGRLHESSLPLRKGGRGRGLPIEGLRPPRSGSVLRGPMTESASRGTKPLPLAPSREGRGDIPVLAGQARTRPCSPSS